LMVNDSLNVGLKISTDSQALLVAGKIFTVDISLFSKLMFVWIWDVSVNY
jgi:hypothetical protein